MNEKKKGFKKAVALAAVLAIALILTMTLSSCITIKVNSVRGSGVMSTEEFDVSDFSRVSFSGIGKVILMQGENESLKVTAEKNIIEAMDIAVSGNTLKIGLKKNYINFIPTREIMIYLSVIDLERLDLSGAGIVECDDLKSGNFSINSSGLGSVKMNLIAESLEVDISGAGKIDMKGEVTSQEISISGLGAYNAKDLISNVCRVDISGAGKATVNVNETLDISMSGLGNVEYTGNPSLTQNISGAGGSVKSID